MPMLLEDIIRNKSSNIGDLVVTINGQERTIVGSYSYLAKKGIHSLFVRLTGEEVEPCIHVTLYEKDKTVEGFELGFNHPNKGRSSKERELVANDSTIRDSLEAAYAIVIDGSKVRQCKEYARYINELGELLSYIQTVFTNELSCSEKLDDDWNTSWS